MKNTLLISLLFCAFSTAQSQNCSVSIAQNAPNPASPAVLTATGSPSNIAVQFAWNNGTTGANLSPLSPGFYCVTATYANGCTASACAVFQVTKNCDVEFHPVNLPGGQMLQANALPAAINWNYQWSTGQTSQNIPFLATGSYCVTASNSDGCIADTCGVPHPAHCSAKVFQDGNFLKVQPGLSSVANNYHWSTGQTTSEIAPPHSGYFCMTLTNSQGCEVTDCHYFEKPAGGPCAVSVVYDANHNAAIATATGTAPFHFSWSNNLGNAAQVVLPVGVTDVCVTVTDATGCTATGCLTVQNQDCGAEIQSNPTNTGLVLTAHFKSADPASVAASYLWNNGSTAANLSVFQPGDYCVTITGTNGCTATDCFTAHSANNLVINVVKPNGSATNFSEVFLISYDTAQGGILTAIDTVNTNPAGTATFQNVPPGKYLAKAALLPSDAEFANYLPTYFAHNLFWSGAVPVSVSSLSPTPAGNSYDIPLVFGQNPGGPGFIGGLVVQGANFAGHEDRGEGDPLAGVNIILEMLNGTPVAATKTGANGKYVFENLAYGTYKVSIEIPGIPVVSAYVTITPNKPEVFTVNFKADNDSAILSGQKSPEFEGLNISPNPTSGAVRISFPDHVFNLVLTNAQGQTIAQTFEIHDLGKIEMQYLPQGIYFLMLRSGSKIYTERIIKL